MGTDEYLITEKPMKALFIFALPMIVGSLFQQVYNMADSIIVGRFVGEKALAAVGASSALTMVFICIAVGAGVGASVLVSRYFGARDYRLMKQSVSTSMIFFCGLSIVLGIFGYLTSYSIMSLLNTPDNVIEMATLYLKIYFIGFPFLFIYNVLSSMFNALGKSRIPLYLLIFSSLFNIGLDIILVAIYHQGVLGAALATLIAQGISAVFSLLIFMKEMQKYMSDSFHYFDPRELNKMLHLAFPSIVQQSTVTIGMMIVQSVVNQFGSQALAGFSAAGRIESICSVIFVSISNALSPYVSQNYGALKIERIDKGYKAGLLMDLMMAIILFILIQLLYKPLTYLFLGSGGSSIAYQTSYAYMTFLSYFYIFMGIKMATDGVLRGLGAMKIFMVANLVNLSIRVLVATYCAPRYGIDFVWIAVPLGWFSNYLISYLNYRRLKRNNYLI